MSEAGSGAGAEVSVTLSIAVSRSPPVSAALWNTKFPDVAVGVKLIVTKENAVDAGVNVPKF